MSSSVFAGGVEVCSGSFIEGGGEVGVVFEFSDNVAIILVGSGSMTCDDVIEQPKETTRRNMIKKIENFLFNFIVATPNVKIGKE